MSGHEHVDPDSDLSDVDVGCGGPGLCDECSLSLAVLTANTDAQVVDEAIGRGVPHRCPVCEGRGMVPWDPAMPYGSQALTVGPWTCPTCAGARVLWSRAP